MIDLVITSGTVEGTHSSSFSEVLALIEEEAPDARTLYYRWEKEQWEAGVLDLSRDVEEWGSLESSTRNSLCAALACVLPPGERLGTLLVPFVDAVDSEEEQVFLTSQLVDQARGVVFADRLTNEVGVTLESNAAIDELFDLVQRRGDEVRVKREQNEALYEGLLLYNVVYEGVIAGTLLGAVGDYLDESSLLRGLRAGLVSLTRDLTRHVLFGIRLLQKAIDRDRGSGAEAIGSVIETTLPLINASINSAAASSQDFAGLPFGDDEVSADAMETLARRMHDIGIDLPT